ncbi:MAG: FeoA family protein [Armatimonadota bacterium]|jgi:Fe2+ transport system protein FeoA
MTTVSFGELKKGMRARIAESPEPKDEVLRLQEMGLIPGTEFKVVKIAPLGDPIEIDLRGYRLCLRKQEMTGFEVEILD